MSITPLREQSEQIVRDTPPQTGQLQQRAVSEVSPPSSFILSSAPRTIEASNEAFLRNLLAAQSLVGRGQITCLPTAQRDRHILFQQRLNNTKELCRQLPNGNDEQTLAEVNRHFALFSDTYNLLIRSQRQRERIEFSAEDHFNLKYRLAQCYAHQRSYDFAIDLLGYNITDIANYWSDQYASFWDMAISLRASIVSGPNPPQNIHELGIRSVDMKLKFLIDSADAFRSIEQKGLAARSYELALEEEGRTPNLRRPRPYERPQRGIDSITKNRIHRFLIEFYIELAHLIMPTLPERAIQLYEKALKLESNPEVFKIIFDHYNKKKTDANSIDTISVRIDSLKKMIHLQFSYGDPESSILPNLRNELFQSYLENGKKSIRADQFEKAIKSFNLAIDIVERENCLVDAESLSSLKEEVFKTLVSWSLHLENQGFKNLALNKIREALDFQRLHRLNNRSDTEALMKRNEQLSKEVNQGQE